MTFDGRVQEQKLLTDILVQTTSLQTIDRITRVNPDCLESTVGAKDARGAPICVVLYVHVHDILYMYIHTYILYIHTVVHTYCTYVCSTCMHM